MKPIKFNDVRFQLVEQIRIECAHDADKAFEEMWRGIHRDRTMEVVIGMLILKVEIEANCYLRFYL